MCGRFSIIKEGEEIEERFEAKIDKSQFRKRYNAAPSQFLPLITGNERERINFFKWGLVPIWAKDISIGNKMINARAETLLEKPSFKTLIKTKRCLVISDGFYEWHKETIKKQAYRIILKENELFAYAGLWSEWYGNNEEVLRTFTIITTAANELMSSIHHRMPVILRREDENKWLNTKTENSDIQALLKPYNANEMELYKISDRINSPFNDDAEVLI